MDGLFQILPSDDGTIIITKCMIHVNPIIVLWKITYSLHIGTMSFRLRFNQEISYSIFKKMY